MKKVVSLLLVVIMAAMLLGGCKSDSGTNSTTPTPTGSQTTEKKTFRIVMIPVCVHPWFDAVYNGSQQEAKFLSSELGYEIKVEYNVPQNVDIAEQNTIIQQAAATKPDAIAICPVDINGQKAIIQEIQKQGIFVGLINQMPPADFPGVVGVGNNFAEQGQIAAKRMVELLGGKGKVAVMHGIATANTHIERYQAILDVLKQNPGITVVEAGFDNDNIENGQKLAAATIAANPDLAGFLTVDASGPIGIVSAVKEAGKEGQIKIVGMDDVVEILQAVQSGVMDSTSATKPLVQGAMLTLMLWQGAKGNELPKFVDTGVGFYNKDNVEAQLKKVRGN